MSGCKRCNMDREWQPVATTQSVFPPFTGLRDGHRNGAAEGAAGGCQGRPCQLVRRRGGRARRRLCTAPGVCMFPVVHRAIGCSGPLTARIGAHASLPSCMALYPTTHFEFYRHIMVVVQELEDVLQAVLHISFKVRRCPFLCRSWRTRGSSWRQPRPRQPSSSSGCRRSWRACRPSGGRCRSRWATWFDGHCHTNVMQSSAQFGCPAATQFRCLAAALSIGAWLCLYKQVPSLSFLLPNAAAGVRLACAAGREGG